MSSESQGSGGRRRRRGAPSRGAGSAPALPTGPCLACAEWAAALDVDAVIAAASGVLSEAGVAVVLPPPLRARAAAAGLEIAGDRVRFPDGAIRALLATVPPRFTHLSRAGAHDVEIGGGRAHLGPPATARWMWSGRTARYLLGAAQVREACDVAAALGLAYDGSALAATAGAPDAQVRLGLMAASDRPAIARLGAGLSAGALCEATGAAVASDRGTQPRCRLIAILSVDAALTLSHDRLGDLALLAEAGAGIVVAPVLLIGSNTPASATGALVRLAAETMAVAALVQMMRPGVPVGIGVEVAEASMRNGMPLATTAEAVRTVAGARSVARRLGLPSFALGPATAAKGLDAQAGTETAAWLSVALGHDVVLGLGGLELDEGLSLEKLVLDADLANALAAPAGISDTDAAAAAIKAAGAGGLFIAERSTREAARDRSRPLLADDWVIESWRAAGAPDTADRAQVVLAEMLMARASTGTSAPATGEASIEPVPRRTITDIAAMAYSRAMRDAFGFKE